MFEANSLPSMRTDEVAPSIPRSVLDELKPLSDAASTGHEQMTTGPDSGLSFELRHAVESACADMLHGVRHIHESVEAVMQKLTGTKKSAFRLRANPTLHDSITKALENLGLTLALLQSVPVWLSIEGNQDTLIRQIVHYIRTVSLPLEKLHTAVHAAENTEDSEAQLRDAFDSYNANTLRWLINAADLDFPKVSGDEGDDEDDDHGYVTGESTDVSKQNTSKSYPANLLSTKRPVIRAEIAALCPLEIVLTRSIRRRPHIYPLGDFTGWASRETPESRSIAVIGSLQSVHLYRSRKAPLHHEYALICFALPHGGEASWIRVERAARFKARGPYTFQGDSFGPLFRGVALRESVSFATTKEALSENSDELSCISIAQASNATGAHFFLDELSRQLSDIARADPLYRLFTANCRMFARRTVFSLAEQVAALNVPHAMLWKGSPVSFEVLHTHLLDDPFGGKQMAGSRGIAIRASTLLNVTRTSFAVGRYSVAIDYAEHAVRLLDSIKKPKEGQQDLIATANWLLGNALVHAGRVDEAIRCLRRSVEISRSTRGEDSGALAKETLAMSLRISGQVDEAIAIRKLVIAYWEAELAKLDYPYTMEILCTSLSSYVHDLQALPGDQTDEMLMTLDRLMSLRRRLAIYRPDLHRRSLGRDLEEQANVLSSLGGSKQEEALACSREAVDVTRQSFPAQPNIARHSLALRLATYSRLANEAGQFEAACEAGKEAVSLFRILYQTSPTQHQANYAHSLGQLAARLCSAGKHEESVAPYLEMLDHERELYASDPQQYAERFPDALLSAAAGLSLAYHSKALPISDESVAFHRGRVDSSLQTRIALAGALWARVLNTCLTTPDANGKVSPGGDSAVSVIGLEASRECVQLWEGIVKDDTTRMKVLAKVLSKLAPLQITDHKDEAASSSARGLHIYRGLADGEGKEEYVERMKDLMSSWSACIAGISGDQSIETLQLTRDHTTSLRAASRARPTIFPEDDFVNCLISHAILAARTGELVEARELGTEAIAVARRLCELPYEQYTITLARALQNFARLLIDAEGASTEAADLLTEALDIHRTLMASGFQSGYEVPFAECASAAASNAHNLGHTLEALKISEEIIQALRALPNSDAVTEQLATSLIAQSAYHHELGQIDEAFLDAVDSVATSRELFHTNPTHCRAGLATALDNLACAHQQLGHDIETLIYGGEAFDHFRVLRQSDPSSFHPLFSRWMRNLSPLVDANRGTIEASVTSVSLARGFFDLMPDEMHVNLAQKLYRHALKLAEVGRVEEACTFGEESIEQWRILVGLDSSTHREGLAVALYNLSADLTNLHRPTDAFAPAQEAIALYRTLLDDTKESQVALSNALRVGAATLVQTGEAEAGIKAAQESVTLIRAVHAADPSPSHLALLTEKLGMLGNILSDREEWDLACSVSLEAVELHRPAFSSISDGNNRMALAAALGLYAVALFRAERGDEAWTTVNEAMDLERQLYSNPSTRDDNRWRYNLSQYAGFSEGLGHAEETLTTSRELVALARTSFDSHSTSSCKAFSQQLFKHARSTASRKFWTESIESGNEAAEVLRRAYAGSDNNDIGKILVDTLWSLGELLISSDHPNEDAARTFAEAIRLQHTTATTAEDVEGLSVRISTFFSWLDEQSPPLEGDFDIGD